MRVALFVGVVGLFGLSPVRASLIVTVDSAGVQNTQLANADVFDFNRLPAGLDTNVAWAGVGTFNQLWIDSADQYGGAGGTGGYAVDGAQASSAQLLSTTLTLLNPNDYFGLWFSAADAKNSVSLYNGNTLLGSFTEASLASILGSCGSSNPYCGNPNTGQDAGEPFFYLNVFVSGGPGINRVVFGNADYTTGFEYDNIAVAATPQNVFGIRAAAASSVPEPATVLMTGTIALGAAAFLLFRRFGSGAGSPPAI